MSAPINTGFDLADEGTVIIPLNRWSRTAYTIQVETGSALLEGTITQINRADRITGVPPTPVWDTLDDDEGNALTAVTTLVRVNGYALEAVRITATDATAGRFMQQGETD